MQQHCSDYEPSCLLQRLHRTSNFYAGSFVLRGTLVRCAKEGACSDEQHSTSALSP